MRVRRSAWGAVALIVVWLNSGALAQSPQATLVGVVRDTSGAVMPGSSIVVQQVDGALTRTATCGASGEFTVAALPPGVYRVTAQAAGFAATTITVRVSVDAVGRHRAPSAGRPTVGGRQGRDAFTRRAAARDDERH
jgi:hypothetical protein